MELSGVKVKSNGSLQPIIATVVNAAVSVFGVVLLVALYLRDEAIRFELSYEAAFSDKWVDLAAESDALVVAFGVSAVATCLLVFATSVWCGIAIGRLAAMKDRNPGGFGLLGFFWPLVALLIVISMRKPAQNVRASDSEFQGREGTLAKCPDCAELIRIEAKRCRFCNFDVDSSFLELRRQLGLN